MDNSDELKEIADEASAEAIHKAKNAQQAVEFAREAQLASAIAQAVKEIFSLDDGQGRKRFVDISRVPLICQAILGIDERLKTMEGNLTWGVRIVIGAFIVALTALVLK